MKSKSINNRWNHFEELMKRWSEAPSSSSTLEQKKARLQNIIKSLIAPESDGGLSNQQAQTPPIKLSREEDFLCRVHGIHYLLRGNKRKILEVQSKRIEAQQKGCNLELKCCIETLAKEVRDLKQQIGTTEKHVQELKQQLSECQHKPICDDPGNTTKPLLETMLAKAAIEENFKKIMERSKYFYESEIEESEIEESGMDCMVMYSNYVDNVCPDLSYVPL